MISTITWNAYPRGINTQGVMERLNKLKNIHHLSMITILEPFSDISQLHNFKNQLAMDKAISNPNGKIWIFWFVDIDCKILEMDEQQITCEITHVTLLIPFIITLVYAKCKNHLRRPKWEEFLTTSKRVLNSLESLKHEV